MHRRRAFPARFSVTLGDTATTLPQLAAAQSLRCDVLSVEGDHRYAGASRDLKSMREFARTRDESTLLLMDDLQCAAGWCKEPTAAWAHARNVSGSVREVGCEVIGCCSGWFWGHYV